jgi:hypothetical protein
VSRTLGENVVAVFGSGDPAPGCDAYRHARLVGRLLAERGHDVANGGYGGTMEASARGAVEGGGQAIAVTCSAWSSPPNEFAARVVTTDSLAERLDTLVLGSPGGYVVLPGGTGTLVELATAWEYLAKRIVPPRPLVCFGAFWTPVIERMASVRPACRKLLTLARDAHAVADAFPVCPR